MNIKKLVNKQNSREWIKANSMSNSHLYREAFTKKYGGIFKKSGAMWLWEEKITIEDKPTKLWIFHKNDGGSYIVENFMEFCRSNELSKSAMYEVMNGKRKSHKGFIKIEKLI